MTSAATGFQKAVAAPSKKKKGPATKSKAPPPPKANPRLVSIPDKSGGDSLKAHYYHTKQPKGLVVLAPGSRGGMGPGQIPASVGKFDPSIRAVYPQLAKLLNREGIACIHFTWRLNPTRKGAPPGTLKSPVQLLLGVEDISLAARYLRAQQGKAGEALPMVILGFSFGGPAVMAAGALACCPDTTSLDGAPGAGLSPLHGVVTMGCGMRVSKQGSQHFKDVGDRLVGGASRARPREYGGLDSESCVDAYARSNLPLAMIHGLADVTVDPEASATIFARARGPKAALWLRDGDHHSRNRMDVVVATMAEWVPSLLKRPRPESLLSGLGRPEALPMTPVQPMAAEAMVEAEEEGGGRRGGGGARPV